MPKHVDDLERSFLEDLLPWSEILPEYIRKPKKKNQRVAHNRGPIIIKVLAIERLQRLDYRLYLRIKNRRKIWDIIIQVKKTFNRLFLY